MVSFFDCEVLFLTNPLLSLAAFFARSTPASFKRTLYRLGPLTRWIRRSLNRAAPHGLSRIQVAAGGLAGAHLLLDLQQEKDYWLGTYETDLQIAMKEWVKPGRLAYDVGANIGYNTLLLARVVGEGAGVVAFEALPANVERLRQNLALNREGTRVQVVAAAVTDRSGEVQFLVGPSDDMGKVAGSAGRQAGYAQEMRVSAISLDDFVYGQGNPPPQVVKMDIEGGEVLALPGMRRILREAHPTLLLELHGPESTRVAWNELTAAGYQLRRMAPGYPLIPALDELDWKAYLVAE